MNTSYDDSVKSFGKVIFSKYFLYIFFPLLIFINMIIFPDLLNHSDIKLNDMSYLLPEVNLAKTLKPAEEENKLTNANQTIINEPLQDADKKKACTDGT